MQPKKLAIGLASLAAMSIMAGIGWAMFYSGKSAPASSISFSPSQSPTQVTTPNPTISVTPSSADTIKPTAAPACLSQIRDAILTFIMTSHNETTPYMQNFMWTGGKLETSLVGSETNQYMSNGWNVTIQHNTILNPVYTVTVEYISLISEVRPQEPTINWQGTWQNGRIVEAFYEFTP